ncbi:MAG: alcohol dehydrogenase catalytic domain-containing protein [bacterium]
MKEGMKAAVFEGEGKLVVKETAVPRVTKREEVLLRVEAASICGTDVHILSVPPGHPATPGAILGHEYVGEVVEAGGRAAHLKPGDRVVVDPNVTCGLCRYCAIGLPNMCENMTTLGIFIDGGFAEYNVAPAKALHRISPGLAADAAIFAEPLSCVINGSRKLDLQAGESVVILGAGPIGLFYTLLLRMSGAGRIIVAEVNPVRAAKARECGADVVVNPAEGDLKEAVFDAAGGGADAAVDAVGSLVNDAIGVVRRGGRVLLFGMNSNARCEFRQYDVTRNEIRILGTFIANHTFPATVQLLESGRLDPSALITHRITLDEIHAGMEYMRRGEAIEVIVTP